jgi:transcriptional regulator with XRE-family HTH domain
MSDRSQRISNLLNGLDSRTSYIRSKLGVLVPSQIRSLRLKSNMPRQSDLAKEAEMQQSRISMFETPGAANLTLDTLSRLAAAFRVGLKVEFVPFSDMLRWENDYSQDSFNVTKLEEDVDFLQPAARTVRRRTRRNRSSRRITSSAGAMHMPIATGGFVAGVQRNLFESTESMPTTAPLADVIRFPNRSGSVLNNLPMQKAAAVGGAGGSYGYR